MRELYFIHTFSGLEKHRKLKIQKYFRFFICLYITFYSLLDYAITNGDKKHIHNNSGEFLQQAASPNIAEREYALC